MSVKKLIHPSSHTGRDSPNRSRGFPAGSVPYRVIVSRHYNSLVKPFDAVLIVAFGGPQGPDDVRPFLANVLRGRRVAPERVEEVAHHYELFGGISPLTQLTVRQADLLRERLHERGVDLPVYVGMRNWHPFLAD